MFIILHVINTGEILPYTEPTPMRYPEKNEVFVIGSQQYVVTETFTRWADADTQFEYHVLMEERHGFSPEIEKVLERIDPEILEEEY